jgi:hypothetical protein
MRKKIIISIGSILLLLSTIAASPIDTLFQKYLSPNVKLLPDYHLQLDAGTFFLHKNEWFKRRYLAEAKAICQFEFLSFRDRIVSVWDVQFTTGLGQLPDNIVFTVMEISYGITPAIEFRLPKLNLVTGLEHHCFHEADRKTYPVAYWNRYFWSVGSKNTRQYNYWTTLVKQGQWDYKSRFSWNGRVNYYVRDFFGLVSETKVNGYNANIADLDAECRYAIRKGKVWLYNLHANSTIGWQDGSLDEPEGIYWRQYIAGEIHFTRSEKAAMFNIGYTLDHVPNVVGFSRFSRDRLLSMYVCFYI